MNSYSLDAVIALYFCLVLLAVYIVYFVVEYSSGLVEAALASAPRRIECRAGIRELELGALVFQAGA